MLRKFSVLNSFDFKTDIVDNITQGSSTWWQPNAFYSRKDFIYFKIRLEFLKL